MAWCIRSYLDMIIIKQIIQLKERRFLFYLFLSAVRFCRFLLTWLHVGYGNSNFDNRIFYWHLKLVIYLKQCWI